MIKKTCAAMLASVGLAACGGGTNLNSVDSNNNVSPSATFHAESTATESGKSGQIVVGYIDGTATGAVANITPWAIAQYDVIIVGFSSCNTATCDSTSDAALLPVFQKVSANVKSGAKVLLSIGGENGSSSFGSIDDMVQYAKALGGSIRNLNDQISTPTKISGVDLDIESYGVGQKITELAKALHDMEYVVSVAPQASANGIGYTNPQKPSSVDPTSPGNFILTASGTTNNDYGAAVAAGYVDYINLQAYNSGAGVISVNGSDETQPDFHENIAHVLNTLVSDECGTLNPATQFYANGYQVCIPSSTKVVIGTVANKTAGGAATMWANEIPTAEGNAAILSAFTASVINARQFPHYGGVMVWALTNDYYPSAWGGNTWDPVGAFTDNIVHFGFQENALKDQ